MLKFELIRTFFFASVAILAASADPLRTDTKRQEVSSTGLCTLVITAHKAGNGVQVDSLIHSQTPGAPYSYGYDLPNGGRIVIQSYLPSEMLLNLDNLQFGNPLCGPGGANYKYGTFAEVEFCNPTTGPGPVCSTHGSDGEYDWTCYFAC